MTNFNPLNFIADHAGMNLADAIKEAYEQGKRDARSEQQWIPCSERLPEGDEKVLATTGWNDVTTAWRIGVDNWFIFEGEINATTEDLIAWMPLPEPWKGDTQE